VRVATDQFYTRRKVIRMTAGRIAVNTIAFLVGATYIYPFIWMAYTTLKTQPEYARNFFSLPVAFDISNYETVFRMHAVGRTFLNSFFNSAVSMVFITFFAFIVGYLLSRYAFRGRNLLYAFFLLGLVIPIHALLIPLFLQFNWLGLLNRRYTLLFPYITFQLPVSIYLFAGYVKTVPRELEEAAFMDGSSFSTTVFRVIFPICLPITSTVLILSFLGIWNEFPFALILLTNPDFRTVPVWLTLFEGQYTTDFPLRLTGMFLASFPVIALFLFFREKVISGLAAGAIKG
jgi:raffinose/stachyose/melibiose transport system permease protein